MTKSFKLAAGEIQQLIPPMGGCMATDKITVEGRRNDDVGADRGAHVEGVASLPNQT